MIAGVTTPLVIIIVVIIASIVIIIVFLAIRTKRIKDEYKVRGGYDRDGERGGGGEGREREKGREGRYIEVKGERAREERERER